MYHVLHCLAKKRLPLQRNKKCVTAPILKPTYDQISLWFKLNKQKNNNSNWNKSLLNARPYPFKSIFKIDFAFLEILSVAVIINIILYNLSLNDIFLLFLSAVHFCVLVGNLHLPDLLWVYIPYVGRGLRLVNDISWYHVCASLCYLLHDTLWKGNLERG